MIINMWLETGHLTVVIDILPAISDKGLITSNDQSGQYNGSQNENKMCKGFKLLGMDVYKVC